MPGQRYRVVHRTEYVYGATMLDGYSVACVLARPTPAQTVSSSVVVTYPEADEYDERHDVFGNRVVQFGLHRPHDGLVVEAITEARIWAQELPRVDVAWERVSATVAGMRGPVALDVAPFVAPSRFVTTDANRLDLFSLATSSFMPGRGIIDATTALCSEIFETFVFDPSFTEVSSPLDVVLGDRRGCLSGLCPPCCRRASFDRARRAVRQWLHRDRAAARRTEDDRGGCVACLVFGVGARPWLARLRPDERSRCPVASRHDRLGTRLRRRGARAWRGRRAVVAAVAVGVGRRRPHLTRSELAGGNPRLRDGFGDPSHRECNANGIGGGQRTFA